MNTAIIVIIFIVALIVSLGFLLLVFTLIPAINQFKSLMKDLEKSSYEVRELAMTLRIMSKKVDQDIDKVEEVLDSAKETVEVAKYTLEFINTNVLQRSISFFALLPAIRLGWNLIKKFRRR
jgi:predicted PurR-regulated permease PerM